MTKVTLFTILNINIELLRTFGESLGYDVLVHDQGGIKNTLTFTPNLTAGHKTALQKILDAAGQATIT